MNAPVVEISTDQVNWGNYIRLIKNQPATVFFRITPNDASLIKFYIPVSGISGVTDTGALLTREAWGDKKLAILKPENPALCSFSQDTTQGMSAINFSPKKYKEVVMLSFAFQAADNVVDTDFGYEYKPAEGGIVRKPIPGQFSVNIHKQAVKPTIEGFTTTSAALLTAEEYTLWWKVKDEDCLYIDEDGKNEKPATEKEKIRKPKPGPTVVTLTATSGTEPDGKPTYRTEKKITILGREDTGIGAVPDPFGGGLLVNLVKKDNDSMYGLVTDLKKTNVRLWKTNDGVKWEQTTIASNQKKHVSAACSSGIYYQGRIYLIGGSRFDPNEKSANVYDLNIDTGEWRENLQTGFTERMGQAVVIVKNEPANVEEIYMLGGYGPEGPLKDIYSFSISAGWKYVYDMKYELCMHTAAFRNKRLEVFGGCTYGPSHADQRMKDALGSLILSDDKNWASLGFGDSADVDALKCQIVTCAMAECKGTEFFFGLYENLNFFIDLTSQIENVKVIDVHSKNYLKAEYCTSLQAIAFKDAIWLCNVSDNDTLYSGGLKYFLFQSHTTSPK